MIKYLIMDVDGTLTDGTIYIGEHGEIMKGFNVKDGYGIANILPKLNVTPIILTGRNSAIIYNRCTELKIKEVHTGVKKKLEWLLAFVEKNNVHIENISYIGDDDNDLECMKFIHENDGLTACPSDASENIRKTATFHCKKEGGKGAVREFIDHIETIQN